MALASKKFNIRRFLTKNIVDIAQSVGGIQFPGSVISTAIGVAKHVGSGNVVRIVVTTAGRVAFGAVGVAAPAAAIDEVSTYLPVGTHYVYATGDYIRSDATLVAAGVEVIAI